MFKRTRIDVGTRGVYKNAPMTRFPRSRGPTKERKMLLAQKVAPALRPMNSYELKETTFLWRPYFPSGVATLLFGPGGSGKSHISVDIAARFSTGRPFPGTSKTLPAQNVLMMSAEDEPERVLGPRLVKAGADLSKVFVPERMFTLDQAGIKIVEGYLDKVSAGIVFIDPIVSFIGGKVDINRSNETREFTGELNRLAQKTGVPIIIVGHSRKGREGVDEERAMGSVDFINAVRSALFTTVAPNGDRIMRHVKANYSEKGPTLSYAFGDGGFEWTGVYQEDGTRQGPQGQKRHSASDWIKEFLAGGPKSAVEVEEAALKQNFNHRTLVRAKSGIAESFMVTHEGRGKWYWKLTPKGQGEVDEVAADIPIMDRQWGTKGPGLAAGGEGYTETPDRIREHAGQVGAGGSRNRESQKGQVDLDQWVKENL